ncbi:N-(5'-phosphoribosyl)anthranilate isomerase [Agaricicola taiwanensis]|uniref:N-(5'-phosphoribosyl)anthranilate isomerase n=1 Tax=Agaricicola taiwanensis TaxID=591372 RepID=A0A8J2YFJ4_9RHOB|nr:phosphoribosylanthranilate isomerase [Agaricicola taiwanensis]GGE32616.1 N-(5'-phosphoribosyl)anthranilate isomerase [Agaricicola taiwanensis]
MAVEIKICGLSTRDTLEAALEAGADQVGFVLFPKSPRNVDLTAASELAEQARGRASVVVLTVDPDDALLDEVMTKIRPDVLQLHGSESPERVSEIAARYDVRIWKAVALDRAEDLKRAGAYAAVADRVLFDAKPPKGADRPGGNAVSFDWNLLAELDLAKPFVLSGGLDPENVGEALRVTRAPAVDVSSGVESAPGIKDAEKIRAFVRAARDASRAERMAG